MTAELFWSPERTRKALSEQIARGEALLAVRDVVRLEEARREAKAWDERCRLLLERAFVGSEELKFPSASFTAPEPPGVYDVLGFVYPLPSEAAHLRSLHSAVALRVDALVSLLDRLDLYEPDPAFFPTTAPPAQPRALSCFLGFSFRIERADRYADHVQRFLRLLKIDVGTARPYEPRRITEKVEAKLDGVDFGVAIIVADGPPTWCRDELLAVHATGRRVIPLLETGAQLEPGLFGDHEWIPFATAHIGDAFLPLLEGIEFIRQSLGRA